MTSEDFPTVLHLCLKQKCKVLKIFLTFWKISQCNSLSAPTTPLPQLGLWGVGGKIFWDILPLTLVIFTPREQHIMAGLS